jgi:hypothetical protein
MTGSRPHESHEPHELQDAPLEAWMLHLATEAVEETDNDVDVPREMMWARIQRDRRRAAGITPRHGWWSVRTRQVAAVAAVLVGGVAIGRYVVPAAQGPAAAAVDTVASARGNPLSPEALASMPATNDPAHVAMTEHLARTVALLTTVRDEDPMLGPGADITPWARELLTTTRLLLDQPQLRDDRTRRLLQDLELVLIQIVQARGTAPETQRAPRETMRETNLLTRVRALVTASANAEGATYGGD